MLFRSPTVEPSRSFAKDPAVVRYKGKGYMYYSKGDVDPANPFGEPARFVIGIAVSDDLDTWTECGVLLPEQPQEGKGLAAPGAIVLDGVVHLFYQSYGQFPRDYICHATSTDGIHFERDVTNPIVCPEGDWNIGRAIDADVAVLGDELFLYWATRDPAGKIQMLGVSSAKLGSGYHREAWRQRCSESILKPELPWEGECIEAPAALSRHGKMYLFYAGAYNCSPQQINCAVSGDGVAFTRLQDTPMLKNGPAGSWNASESGHPYVFEDEDGKVYLFYQGSPDGGVNWLLSRAEVVFDEADYPHIRESADLDFRGNAYIVQGERVLREYVSGLADLPNGVPNTLETRFASASAGKVFVAVGILRLIEGGKLRFDDTLGDLLDIDLHEIDPGVTVRQLLNHTSGVPDYFDESVMEEYEELWADYPNYKIRHNSDLLPLFIDKPMMYPKGERFQYNNSGYVLLAMILEKVTGMAFDEYLRKNVFDVCGMTSTGYYELDRLPARCAQNYIFCGDTGEYRTNIFSVDAKGTGAGGAFITVGDIVRFWKGLLEGKLLSGEMVSKMLSRQSGDGLDPEEGHYGYGVWIREDPKGKDVPYFQGSDPGVSFISEYDPNKGTISVLVSNYGDNVWKEMRKIRKGM